jgi:23S rRNA pseudouridine1911/1915/1917 synthase
VKASITVHNLERPTRLDRVLRNHFPDWGRQAVQRLISSRQVTVNGRLVWLGSWTVQNGDRVEIADPPPPKPDGPSQFDEAWIIAVTPELIAVNKPAGLLAEPTRWGQGVNLRDLAVARFGPLLLFHRLDRDTSGVLLLTRPGSINQSLDRAFKSHLVQKEYLAVVGRPNRLEAQGVIHSYLAPHPKRRDKMEVVERGGQHAVTRYAIAAEHQGWQLVRLWPHTGRTHQLRVQLAHLGAPIRGDRLYGPSPRPGERLYLHAQRLDLPAIAAFPAHTFVAPLPVDFWASEVNHQLSVNVVKE